VSKAERREGDKGRKWRSEKKKLCRRIVLN
jgi:hypothetical protein